MDLGPGNLIGIALVGLISGALASRVVAGRGFGCLADIVVGVAGALIGGIIVGSFVPTSLGFLGQIVVAFIGAVLLLAVVKGLAGGRL